MKTKIASLCLAASIVWIGVGCEADDERVEQAKETTSQPEASAPAAPPAATETAPASASATFGDELDVSNARSYGTHSGILPQNARITRTLYKADKEGELVMMDFDALNWPKDGGLDGRVCMYWIEGSSVVGGHFDWHKPGQTAKTLENIYGGYLGGKRPAGGSPVWFCIINNAGTERTNMKLSQNTW